MRRRSAIHSLNGADDLNDFTMTSVHLLRFSSVLDVSIFVRTIDSLFAYLAKVQSTIRGKPIVGHIFFILFLVQTLFPSIMINDENLWPRDSIITQIFTILEGFWDGPSLKNQEGRVTMSFILSIVYLLAYIYLFLRSHSFSDKKTFGIMEAHITYFFFRYFLVFLLPLLLSGFPFACHKVRADKDFSFMNVVIIILIPIFFISYVVFLLYLFLPRVLLENAPLHEWVSVWAIFQYVSTSLTAMLSTCVGFEYKYPNPLARALFPIIIFLMHFFVGIIQFNNTLYPRRLISLIMATTEFTSAFIALVQTINIFFLRIGPEIILICIFTFFIIIYIVLKMLNTKNVHHMMIFCDECMNTQQVKQLMDDEFKSPNQFMAKTMLLIDQWHPYIVTWKLFDYATSRWPNSYQIFLLYGRLVSFFPSMNSTMIWICTLIAKFPNSFLRSTYLRQFSQISQSRQITITKLLKTKIDDVQNRTNILLALLRRFWGNVLQKNTSNFWDDADRVIKYINEVDAQLFQLTQDFPNNVDVWQQYSQFVTYIKHDMKAATEIQNKIHIIESFGRQGPDIAMSLALQIYPNIQPYVQNSIDTSQYSNQMAEPDYGNDYGNYHPTTNIFQAKKNKSNNNNNNNSSSSSHNDDDGYDNDDGGGIDEINTDADYQMELATQELTQQSKLGRVWLGMAFVIVMTFLTIIVFYLFSDKYMSSFIQRQRNALTFMSTFSQFYYHFADLNLIIMTYPLFLAKLIKPDRTTMDIIAPNLYTVFKAVPVWYIDKNDLVQKISEVNYLFADVLRNIAALDADEKAVKEIIFLVTHKKISNGDTFQNSITQVLSDVESFLSLSAEAFLQTLENQQIENNTNNIFDTAAEIFDRCVEYSSKNFGDSFDTMNELMVITIMVTMLLVTLPFMLQLFSLQIQNEAISNSFAFFPNSEIRSVITKFGLQSKIESDVNHVALLAHRENNYWVENIQLGFTFFGSFVPLTLGCLTTYFMAQNFISDVKKMTESLSLLYNPFTSLIRAMECISRTFVFDALGLLPVVDKSLYMNISMGHIENAHRDITHGMWSSVNNVGLYYETKNNGGMEMFNLYFETSLLARTKSLFERLATIDFPFTLDLLMGSLKTLINDYINNRLFYENSRFLSLSYYFTNFSDINRNVIYFSLVENHAKEILDQYEFNEYIATYVVIVWQIIACLLIMYMMINRHIKIKNSLRFYQDLSPSVLAQNHNAMNLLDTGKSGSDRVTSSFSRSDEIIMSIPQGVFLADRDLLITDVNPAFKRMTRNEKEIRNLPLTSVVKNGNLDDHSWPDFIQHVTEIFSGKCKPQFNESVTVEFVPGEVSHLLINVVGLVQHRQAQEGEFDNIDRVAIIIDDCTSETAQKLQIEKEQNEVKTMLTNVLPKQVVFDISESGEDSVAFVVQSTTIGFIHLSSPKLWEYSPQAILSFYDQIFGSIDKIIEDFDLICKIRTSENMYMFAGGLFEKINKPERHADQACKFALRVVKEVSQIVNSIGAEIELTAGVHSGGPVVAGIMGISRPSFQIVGPVTECASQLAIMCSPGTVQVSRSVYELIFSSGFRVFEKGETIIRGGNAVQTYVIST